MRDVMEEHKEWKRGDDDESNTNTVARTSMPR